MLVLKYQAVYNHTDSFMLVLKYQEVYNHTDSFVLVLKYQEVYNHTDNTLYQAAFLLVLQLLTMLIETQIKPKSFELRRNQLKKKNPGWTHPKFITSVLGCYVASTVLELKLYAYFTAHGVYCKCETYRYDFSGQMHGDK